MTGDVAVAICVGYGNAKGKRTLGHGGTGGRIAVSMVEPIIPTAWTCRNPMAPLQSAAVAGNMASISASTAAGVCAIHDICWLLV